MSKHLMILIFASMSLMAGCQSGPSYSEKPVPLDAHSFSRQWATQLEGGSNNPVTAIHVIDQYVFAFREDGTSTVLDRATGRMLHRDQPRGSTVRMHPPVVIKDRIVYPTTNYLEVFDMTGRYIPTPTRPGDEMDKAFSHDLRFAIRSDVVALGRYAFFGADFRDSGRAVEVDLTRPYVPDLWTLMTPGSSVSAAPAVTKDRVFVAAEDGTVMAVAIDNREPLWTLEHGVFITYGGVVANLVLDDNFLYVASTDSKLYCLVQKTGKVQWQYFSGQQLREAPVVTKTMVYQMVPTAGLVAIEKTPAAGSDSFNRKPRWIAGNATKFLSEDDKYAYVATDDNHIAAIDKQSGQVRFVSKRNDFTFYGVNNSGDGLVYTADAFARVMAVRPVLQGGGVGEVAMVAVPRESIAIAR